MKYFDVIIIGAGSAGSAAAVSLSDSGLNIAIIDKSEFPRRKTCGDVLSADVINQLGKMPNRLFEKFIHLPEKQPINNILISTPNQKTANLFIEDTKKQAYISKRYYFDNFLLKEAIRNKKVSFFSSSQVIKTSVKDNYVEVRTKNNTIFRAKILLHAGGISSKYPKLTHKNKDDNYISLAVQGYFKNVNLLDKNTIELHFTKNILPGYFWIFPNFDNTVNVGLGMLKNQIKDKNINLKELLFTTIQSAFFADRFSKSELIDKLKMSSLHFGGRKLKISSDRVLLLGDAAWLVAPFSGEGIGNAIRSGRFAAEHVKNCFENNCFDEHFNIKYDKKIYNSVHNEQKKLLFIQKSFTNKNIANLSIQLMKNKKLLRYFIGF